MGRPVAEPELDPAPSRAGRRPGLALATSRPVVALGRGMVRALAATLRLRELPSPGVEAIWRDRTPTIYTVWHGQILLLPLIYGRRHRLHALTSRSRDGEILSRFVEGFGIRVVRGSSSRGGPRALRTLARVIRETGENALIVPDGPRGPRHIAQHGAVMLAKMTGAPMVPLAFGAAPCRVLGSWDAFVVPYPFARAAVVFGEPIAVAPDAQREALETKRQELESALNHVSAEAARVAGGRHVPAL